ncbi:malto-oligosyltrehalose trehalohydrolase [Luteimicrobium subarcticum]|uniref:Malto-oligosyltrehalose trehalohydrolase n=1 Tax=Luteimicrobium subarcticum TaxID=620910 RepID=A0A2M8W419_9MICO|nr:malto-oligosyltrehalose trehalohydrolase [Luteimicrobium subarcticum]PJI85673.1 maltooligosyl trehalose hydrolase [Luteimicrobium subarcticum]
MTTAGPVPTAPQAEAWVPAVWAPDARTVDLVLPTAGGGTWEPARRVALHPVDRPGWWSAGTAALPADLPDGLPPGTDYGFSLDGGPGLPDPRSPRQPWGVHGPSRVDAEAFVWTDGYRSTGPAPGDPPRTAGPGREVLGTVVYELHVGTFTPEGTLDAAAAHLDHLVDLGVQTVELMPVAAFPGRWGWGYDGVHLFAVHEPYGGPDALRRFVDAAHGAGLGVVLDVVHNHLGPSGNYLGAYGPYFTEAHHTPWGAAVNLDQPGSAEVRRFLLDNALRWLTAFHLDGLRLDAVHALVDDSPRHLLAELADTVAERSLELGRPLTLVAESDENDPATVQPTAAGGRGMDAQWADDVHHAVHAYLTGERHGYYVDFGSAQTLRKALTGAFVHDGTFSTFRDRPWGRPVPAGTDGHRFVVFASDHDQVGNRALGDRPAAGLDAGALAASAALVLCSPFTPMLFMGEEWGASTPWQYFTDHDDPELARAVSEGRRREFGGHGWADLYGRDEVDVPDPQAPGMRDASVLDWSEPGRGPHARLLAWYRDLVALRAEPAVSSGDLGAVRVTASDDDAVVVVERPGVVVVVSRAEDVRTVRLPSGGRWRVAAAWETGTAITGNGHGQGHGPAQENFVTVPARSVAVLLAG